MDETILFPSPNWFQVSGLAVSKDKWLIYGGPAKSLCFLVPLSPDHNGLVVGTPQYKAYLFPRIHPEKITSVDISPEWPEKRSVLTGSADGAVKHWLLGQENYNLKVKQTHSHEVHSNEMEELAGVGYSNEVYAITVGAYGNIVKWDLKSNVVKTYANFMRNFKPTCMSCSRHVPLNVAVGTKQGVIFLISLTGLGKVLYKVRGQDDEIVNLSWCPQYEVALKKVLDKAGERFSAASRLEKIRNEPEPSEQDSGLNSSGISKDLPEDSFNESIVEEDDTFDIYKDHEADEFGHKKYQPEDILVKVTKDEAKQEDYLAECLKLKEEILKRKNDSEQSIETLVDALDKTQIDDTASGTNDDKYEIQPESDEVKPVWEGSDHIHRHLLATIGKFGGVRIWSKTGKLVASCAVQCVAKNKAPNWPTLLWYKPDMLLIADGKNQLLECNPFIIDSKNKLKWHIVHTYHRRGLYGIASDAPRVHSPKMLDDDWSVWTIAQDRTIIRYCMKTRQKISVQSTCAGYIYSIKSCPYDAGKVALSVGDGAIRIWQTHTLDEDSNKLDSGHMTTYWQNVQGKVLTVAWHPTKENLLAFSTAESRVGLIDTGGKVEKPARVFVSSLGGGVYALCWGEEDDLYACSQGDLVIYNGAKTDKVPRTLPVMWEGKKWELSTVVWYPHGLLVGSNSGAVALMKPSKPHNVIAAGFPFGKMIHTIDWHPQETTCSSEESQFKDLIAVCSLDKSNSVVILEYTNKEDDSPQLSTWKILTGHKAIVFQVQWNPHRDAQLLSSSQDSTVRVWDAAEGVCTSIYVEHTMSPMGVTWSAFPQFADYVMSGGADSCLRMWDIKQHLASAYQESKRKLTYIQDKKKNKDTKKKEEETDLTIEENVATSLDTKIKVNKKFLLAISYKQITNCNTRTVKKMIERYQENASGVTTDDSAKEPVVGVDFLKMFGTINEVNELLDIELERLMTNRHFEAWIMLMLFRGHIDPVIQFANQNDMLCPFLVSIAPCVSFKYWKDVSQLYSAQVDRMMAKDMEEKLFENRFYGGAIYRKVSILLSLHDIKGAVEKLLEVHLYKEAYVLCRIRHMDSIAQQTLAQWANICKTSGLYSMSAVCYIALGNLSKASEALVLTDNRQYLSLAAELAKLIGQNTFADHIEKKVQTKIEEAEKNKTEEILQDLPSRVELLLKDGPSDNNSEFVINGGSKSEE
ncbi:hypothetical protein K1T71_004896 [Dendrolimus kikuchii]|uniref:Uncharacterized protein n=1 Tax=Dendrolimus kikuchii TaxID=765133 RepID=A0ACC1D643_9NEOP|nr:hypothetical protein K1T71_004896 [Dendrolimus kikuchii]